MKLFNPGTWHAVTTGNCHDLLARCHQIRRSSAPIRSVTYVKSTTAVNGKTSRHSYAFARSIYGVSGRSDNGLATTTVFICPNAQSFPACPANIMVNASVRVRGIGVLCSVVTMRRAMVTQIRLSCHLIVGLVSARHPKIPTKLIHAGKD